MGDVSCRLLVTLAELERVLVSAVLTKGSLPLADETVGIGSVRSSFDDLRSGSGLTIRVEFTMRCGDSTRRWGGWVETAFTGVALKLAEVLVWWADVNGLDGIVSEGWLLRATVGLAPMLGATCFS